MKKHWPLKVLKFVLFAIVFVAVMSYVVMNLWNWLVPTLFGGHTVTFWQALGLLILGKILFGGFHGRAGKHMYGRHRMMERWARMSPEEREKFREEMRGHCGPFSRPVAEPKP